MDRFIDVSNHQGTVNWDSVKSSGRIGAICKATEGTSYTDPTFRPNFSALDARHMVRGAYHFARPNDHAASTEANFFLMFVGAIRPNDILVLDIEVGSGGLSSWALQWLQIVKQKTGITPWVYSYGSFLSAHLTDPALAAYPLWLAAYQSTQPAVRYPWTKMQAWQHSSSIQVPGVNGNCDESYLVTPLPVKEVKAMYNPALSLEPIVADLACPTGGAWLLAADGSVYGFGGAPYLGGANGKPYFVGRTAAQLNLINGQYQIVATSGETYGPGF